MAVCKECYDHLGNAFKNTREMCSFWKVNYETFKSRIRHGKSLKEALTIANNGVKKEHRDHLGNRFESLSSMLSYYKIKESTYHGRLKLGWNLEEILTTPLDRMHSPYKNHNVAVRDKKFNNLDDALAYYGISKCAYYNRRKAGWSVEDALTTPTNEKFNNTHRTEEVIDHTGKRYTSAREMCNHYGIALDTFKCRIKSGWSLKDALIKPSEKYTDTFGNTFYSVTKMCEYYGIKRQCYDNKRRLDRRKYTLGECLEIEGRGLDNAIRKGISLNSKIFGVKFEYTGRNGKKYYKCIDVETSEELIMNADEILVYKQLDYRTAVEQLIVRRRGALNG